MTKTARAGLARDAGLLAILAAPSARAEGPAEEFVPLDSIAVTGEKTARDRTETASWVAARGAEEIRTGNPGKGDVRAFVEGAPNVIDTDEVSAPTNLDGHRLSCNEFYFGATSPWDVESVEVFRGPQTTSQGANAIAGAIIVNTKDPGFDAGGAYRPELGDYGQRRASAAHGGEIRGDFAGRIAVDHSQRDAFIDHVGTTFIQNEIGQDFTHFNARGKLRWEPSRIAGLRALPTCSRSRMTRPGLAGAAAPYAGLESITTHMPGRRRSVDTGVLGIDRETAEGTRLKTSFEVSADDVDRRVGRAGAGDAAIGQLADSNESQANFGGNADALSGLIGFRLARSAADEALDQGGLSTFDDETLNLGLYGEISRRPAERRLLTGGLRLQHDRIERSGDVSPFFANYDLDYEGEFTEPPPKLSLSFEATQGWTIGGRGLARVQPGRAAGESALRLGQPVLLGLFQRPAEHHPDHRRRDLHPHHQRGRSAGLRAGGLRRLAPIPSLTPKAGAGLLSTEFTRFDDAADCEGDAFARAPGCTPGIGASWQATDRITLGASARFVDGRCSDAANTAAHETDGYTPAALGASYRLTVNAAVYAYANNAFDERTPIMLRAARGDTVFAVGSMTAPRMVGIGLRGEF